MGLTSSKAALASSTTELGQGRGRALSGLQSAIREQSRKLEEGGHELEDESQRAAGGWHTHLPPQVQTKQSRYLAWRGRELTEGAEGVENWC